MRQTYESISGKDMLMLVKDMQWLSGIAEKEDKQDMKILSSTPIDNKNPPKSKKAKTK